MWVGSRDPHLPVLEDVPAGTTTTARTEHNSCIPWAQVQKESCHYVPRAFSNKGIKKYRLCLLCIQMTTHSICVITFSISLKACLIFLLDLSSPFKACLRRMIASQHFIIPLHFHSSWHKRFRQEYQNREGSWAYPDRLFKNWLSCPLLEHWKSQMLMCMCKRLARLGWFYITAPLICRTENIPQHYSFVLNVVTKWLILVK